MRALSTIATTSSGVFRGFLAGSLALLVLAAAPANAAPPSQPNPQPLWNAYPLAGTQTQTTTTPVEASQPRPKRAAIPRATSSSGNDGMYEAGVALTVILALALGVWVVSWAGFGPWGDGRGAGRFRARRRSATAQAVAVAEPASSFRHRPEVNLVRGLGRGRGTYRDVTAERVADRGLEPEEVTEREPETVTELLDDTSDVPPHRDERGVEALKAKAAGPTSTTATDEGIESAELKMKLALENKIDSHEAATLKAKLGASPALAPPPGTELLSSHREALEPASTVQTEAPLEPAAAVQTEAPPRRDQAHSRRSLGLLLRRTPREGDIESRRAWWRRLRSRRAVLFASCIALALAAGIVTIVYTNWIALAVAVLLLTAAFVSRS
jgi:hypothetical protein